MVPMRIGLPLCWVALGACQSDPPLPGSEAGLAGLSLGSVEVEPPFEPERRTYAVSASSLSLPVDVQAEPVDADAQVTVSLETVDGEPLATGNGLQAGPNQRIRIEVTSADGSETRTYAVGLLPDTFPRPTAEGTASAGWTFLSTASRDSEFDDSLMVVDDLGTPAWWRKDAGTDFRIAADGRFTWFAWADKGHDEPRGVILAPQGGEDDVSLVAGDVPDGWQSVQTDEHEWDVLDDGTALRIINGKVLEDLTAFGGWVDQQVEHQKAQHVDLDGNVLFEFSTQGLLPYEVLPPNLAEKMSGPDFEPFHINSIDIDPYDGHWVLSLQRVSMVVKVARHGPQEGQVLWKLGGPSSDFTLIDDERPSGWTGFAGQHDVRVVGPDRISMFDAGLGDSDNVGDVRFVEYQLDLDTMEARVVDEHVWSGWGNGWAGGTVQSLPGGGHLVGFGSLLVRPDGAPVPVATELSAGGDEAWSLWLPGSHWSYRAWRFEGDPLTGGWTR